MSTMGNTSLEESRVHLYHLGDSLSMNCSIHYFRTNCRLYSQVKTALERYIDPK